METFDLLCSLKTKNIFRIKQTIPSAIVFMVIFFIMLFGSLRVSSYFVPGIISPDNMVIYDAAVNINEVIKRSDVHSFAMIILIKLFTLFTDNYYIITVVFDVLFSLVWSYMMLVLYKQGFPFIVEIVISILYILMPSNAYLFAATWKDIPFIIFLLLLSSTLMRIVYNNYQTNFLDLILLAMGMIGTALFRNNGQLSFLICSVILVVIGIIKKYKQIFLISLFSIGIVFFFKGPLFHYLNVDRGPEGFASIPFIDGVWENIHSKNELDQETLKYLNDIMPIEKYDNAYLDYYTNTIVFPSNLEGIRLSDSAKAYFKCLIRYPLTTLKARMKKTFNLWSVYPNTKFPVNYNLVRDINIYTTAYGYDWHYTNEYCEERERIINSLADGENGLFHLINRGSIGLIISLILTFYNIMLKEKDKIIIILPALCSHIALLIACCYNDYRYSWPMFVLTIPYLCFFFIGDNINANFHNN